MRPVSVNSRTARVALSLFFSFMYATLLSGCNKANLDAAPIAEKPGELTKTVAALQGTDGEYGSLSGKVTFMGELPKVIDLTATMKAKDATCCLGPKVTKQETVDLTWVIDPQTKGVANVMVWIVAPKGKFFPIPEKLKKRDKELVTFDQPHCQYIPRIAAYQPVYNDNGKKVPTGQKLAFKNSAGCPHNVRVLGNGIDNDGFNINLPPGSQLEKTLNPQRLPLSVQCDIHPWMSARLFVFDHPYYAITDKDGKFTIPIVPAGAAVAVMGWHEGIGWTLTNKGQVVAIEKGKTKTLDFQIKAP